MKNNIRRSIIALWICRTAT